MIFGWLPVIQLRREGRVSKGNSYVHTKVLVDSGLYTIIRHPQYAAGILLSLSQILISQNWIILVLGAVVVPMLYLDIVMAEERDALSIDKEALLLGKD